MASLTPSIVGQPPSAPPRLVPTRWYGYDIDPETGIGTISESHVVANGTRGGIDQPVAKAITGATASATSATLTGLTLNAPGTGATVGAVLTLTGGTYTTAGEITIATAQVISATVTDPGLRTFQSGVSFTVDGGTGTKATFMPATLKLTGLLISDRGTGYVVNEIITLAGGTFSVAAELTVEAITLVDVAINAAGQDYLVGDRIQLSGGTVILSDRAQLTVEAIKILSAHTTISAPGSGMHVGTVLTFSGGTTGGTTPAAATVTLTHVKLVGIALNSPGTGMAPGTVLTMVGGTFGTAAQATVTTTKVVTATIAAGGVTGMDGIQTIVGTTGAGTRFQAEVTVDGGAITSIISFTPGSYTTNPTAIANEPVEGGGLTGAQLALTMGVETFTITTAGDYTADVATLTSTGGGNNATFTGASWGALTFTVTNAGSYIVGPATFAAEGGDDNATFAVAHYAINEVSIYTGGKYSVGSTSFTIHSTSSAAGTGATFNGGVFGIYSISISTAGNYTVTDRDLTQDSTTGAGIGLALEWCEFGLITFTVVDGGSYSVQPATLTATAMVPATFGSIVWGVKTFTISNPGNYSVAPSTFTVSGGSGATFQSATYATTTGTHCVITVPSTSGFATGFDVTISGTSTTPNIDGTWTATVISPTTFSIPTTLLTGGAGGSVQLAAQITREVEKVNETYAIQGSSQFDVSTLAAATNTVDTYIAFPWPNKLLGIYNFTDRGSSESAVMPGSIFAEPCSLHYADGYTYGPAVAALMSAAPDGKIKAQVTRSYHTTPPTVTEEPRQIYLCSGEIIKCGGQLNNGLTAIYGSSGEYGEVRSAGRTVNYAVDSIPHCLSGNVVTTGSGDATLGIPTVAIRITPSSPTTFYHDETFCWDVQVTPGRSGLFVKHTVNVTTPASGGPAGYFA